MSQATLDHPALGDRTQPTTNRFAAARGWLVAFAYFGLALWLLRDDAWRYGSAIWGDGPFGLPMVLGRVLTWLSLLAMLLFGLCWATPNARRWVWLVSGVLLLGVACLAGWWWAAMLVLALHLFGFNPGWLPADLKESNTMDEQLEPLFYDGMCGLCHRWVKIVLRADPEGKLFYFSPLQGDEIKRILSEPQREALPDSIVVYTHDKQVLTKTNAVIHILRRLGGWYRFASILIAIFPRPIRDFGYDIIAKIRHRLFKTPDNACPATPPDQRERFVF